MNYLAIVSEGLYPDQRANDIYIANTIWSSYIVSNGLYTGSNVYYYPQDDSLDGLDLGMEMGL